MNTIACVAFICVSVVFTRAASDLRIDIETIEAENTETRYGHEPLSRINKGKVCLGEPEEQCFNMMLDTGSSDFWVFSTMCNGPLCEKLPNKYDHSSSRTFSDQESGEAKIKYGTGKIRIQYAKETVNFGNIKVQKQDLGEALNADEKIVGAHLDGVLGLAFKVLAHHHKSPLFYTMYSQQHQLNPDFQNVFTFCKPSGKPSRGELILGSTAPENYDESELVYTPVTESKWWKFTVDSIHVEGADNGNDGTVCTKCVAVADSGTTLVRGHKDDISAINNFIGAEYHEKGHYRVDCDQISSLPTVVLNIGGKPFPISANDYVYKTSNGTCLTGFAVTHTTQHFWILGGTFLDGLCTIYDMGKPQLGFVKMQPQP